MTTTPGAADGRRPRLAAVVLNYRTPEQTLMTVGSLRASRRRVDQLIVVDNGPEDGAGHAPRLPGVTLLETTENLGFSGGCNVGVRHALERGADLVMLVNSDVWVPPDCVGRLEDAMTAASALGVVGPILLSRSDPERVASLGISYSESSGRMRHEGYGRCFASLTSAETGVVAGVSGCVMLVRRQVFEEIGLLDEDYFFTFEDLDFCLRARRAGFASAIVAGAVAYHEGSGSLEFGSPSRVYFASRNHLLLASRAAPHGNRAMRLVRAACVVGLNVAHVLVSSPTPVRRGLPALIRGVRDHLLGRYGVERTRRPLTPPR